MIRNAVQNDVNRDDRTFQHGSIRLAGCEPLHLHTRPPQDACGFAVRMSQAHQHFVADTGDDWQHSQMEKKAQEKVADGHQYIQHEKQQDADPENDQQESCSAAGMQAREGLRILRSQRQAGFMTVNGLMLCTVVLEGPADVRYETAEDHIADRQGGQ